MIGTMELKHIALGALGGGVLTWLFMFDRIRQIRAHARTESEVIKNGTAELLGMKDLQVMELKDELKAALEDLEELHEKLRHESEYRASAEEKNSRIPGLEKSLVGMEADLGEIRSQNGALQIRLAEAETRLEDERKSQEEKLVILAQAKDQLKVEFQNVANRIFEDKSQKFTDQNKENIDGVLKPVREQLNDFRKKIEDVYDKESKERLSLFNEIINLKGLNERISEDAVNLTQALKGKSKTQGAWGEVVLERILENSGLRKGWEYETQESLGDEDGRQRRPDVIVHLPDEKDVIIDSKVTLTAYERFSSADDPDKREKELKNHLLSIRTHMRGLSKKNYENLTGVKSLDFVLMFLPIEGAFMAAVENDPTIFNEGLEKNIIMVSPSTLLATLRTIQNIWRFEYQNRNAQIIAKKAGELYDKFIGFIMVLEEVGHKIKKAQEAYDTAHNRLASGKGNLVKRARELELLGITSRKTLPESLVEKAMAKD